MKKKTIKKTFLNIFILSQIFFLILGSTPVASASWASLRYDIDEDDVPAGIKDEGEYEVAATYKRSDQVPKVSVMYSPSNPKPGDEVTATAMAQPFANEEKDLYYTWFLKRKGCGIEGDDNNKFAVSSTEYDPDKDYPSYAEIVKEDSEAASCDTDEDGMVTVNDWKVEAARILVPSGFKPDLGGRYSTLDAFYAEDEDGDGYQTWQGGADAERMPNHCYGYDATSGIMLEYVKNNKKKGNMLVPCGCTEEEYLDGDCNKTVLPACAETITYEVSPAEYHFCGCYGEQNHLVSGEETAIKYCMGCTDEGWANDDPSCYQGAVKCHKDTTVKGAVIGFGFEYHADCDDFDPPSTTQNACRKLSDAVCNNVGTVDDPDYQAQCSSGVLVCPLYPAEKYSDPSGYFFGQTGSVYGGISAVTADQPVCGCENFQSANDVNQCVEGVDIREELLCGSLTKNSYDMEGVTQENQYHVFPLRLSDTSDGAATENYYEKSREYDSEDEEEYEFLPSNTGNNKFNAIDERYWGTDPRNPSTAGNGKFDEANLAGLGATTFTWTYADGDELGVAVEGTSNVGTKFPDSSRMIMWAFSKGMEATTDEENSTYDACQPQYSGDYQFEDFVNYQGVALSGKLIPDIVTMPTGFMDFDRCIEKSTLPVILGGGSKGAQPKNMEVELSATPAKPLNDETGEGKGDVIDIQAVITGSDGTENELSYSWTIKGLAPGVDSEDLSVAPSQRDWDDEDSIICDKDSGSCPLRDEGGGKLALSGTGIPELSFRLNIVPDDALYAQVFNENGDGYFKVTMEARESDESSDPPNSRYGYGEVIIKANTSSNRITIFHPAISGSLLSSQGSDFFCTEPGERSTCQVMKNEIVGLTVLDATIGAGSDKSETLTEFQWYLDGKPINDCDSEMSSECQDGKSTNVTFIPVLGEEGDTFRVSVQAKNISGGNIDPEVQTGKKVELSQDFKIVQPSLKIVSADEGQVWPKLLGNSVNLALDDDDANKYTEDYSQTVLETASGNNAQLKLEYVPSFLNNLDLPASWMIDGASATEPSFTAGETGTVHNVSASAVYEQSVEVNRMLNLLFDVPKSELTSQTISSSIQIEVNEVSQAAAFKNPTRFLANLLSKVPSQILFFIRLLLSVAMTIVLVGVIFAFFPETAYDRRRIER